MCIYVTDTCIIQLYISCPHYIDIYMYMYVHTYACTHIGIDLMSALPFTGSARTPVLQAGLVSKLFTANRGKEGVQV